MIVNIPLKPFVADPKPVSSTESSNNKVTPERHTYPARFSPYFNNREPHSEKLRCKIPVKSPVCVATACLLGSWEDAARRRWCAPSHQEEKKNRYYMLFGQIRSHFAFAPEDCIILIVKSDGALGGK